jgi:Mor family transcriptional regulator
MSTAQHIKNLKNQHEGKSIEELISSYNLAISKISSFSKGKITQKEMTSAQIQYYILSEILEKKRKTAEFKKHFNL